MCHGKSQKLVQPFLVKILLLCFSDSSNFFLMEVQNWNNPKLAGVKLSLFCHFWHQHHVPQIGQCIRCLGTILGSHVKLLCPNLGDAMIEIGTNQFFLRSAPTK